MPHERFDLWTLDEVASYLRTGASTCRKMLKEGQFPEPFSIGGQPLWRKEDVFAFVNVLAREGWRQQVGRERAFLRPAPPGSVVAALLPVALLPVKSDLLETCNCPAVYFLFCGDVVIYVGSSINPARRLNDHAQGTAKTPKKDFTHALCLPVPLQELIETEKKFIALLDPPLNVNLKPKTIPGRPEPASNGEQTS
jgi:excisionase family DNA binding protein